MSSFHSMDWKGKAEPSSPHFSDNDDLWLFEDNLARDLLLDVDSKLKNSSSECIAQSRSELAQQLLNELDHQVKEEPFSQWLEEKVDLPLFEDLSMDSSISTANLNSYMKCSQQCTSTPQHQNDTQSLLREFEYVYDTVELNHLTPPQSPPASSTNASFYPPQFNQQDVYTNLVPLGRWDETYLKQTQDEFTVVNSPQTGNLVDVQRELADVEELVRRRAQDIIPTGETELLPYWMTDREADDDSCVAPEEESGVASPASSETSLSDRDEDWVPQQVTIRSGRSRTNKPYIRSGVEDRKSRKKEQNKNAATRYRQKKKAQIEEILGEERGLMDRNEELKAQCTDVEREIKYLKGLMRDLFRAKGLI